MGARKPLICLVIAPHSGNAALRKASRSCAARAPRAWRSRPPTPKTGAPALAPTAHRFLEFWRYFENYLKSRRLTAIRQNLWPLSGRICGRNTSAERKAALRLNATCLRQAAPFCTFSAIPTILRARDQAPSWPTTLHRVHTPPPDRISQPSARGSAAEQPAPPRYYRSAAGAAFNFPVKP